ncbi:MAG: SDR family oxidoreductase [Sphingomonadaceae bacterium]|nr:SDR family oxidoreductase [Sphingomonadaceae bacterium]
MDKDHAAKVAIVTGAAGGIGIATAQRLARDGFRVVLSDIAEEPARQVADELGGIFQPADVTNESDVAALVDCAISKFGRLDVMINNAGQAGAVGHITDITAENWSRTIAIILDSVFYGIKHAARAMIAGGRSGSILSTTSISAQRAVGGHPYIAAKHALIGLTRSAANDLAPHGIRVNGVAPGYVLTPMTVDMFGGEEAARDVLAGRSALPSIIEPGDIADAFGFLASDGARAITGQQLTVDAGFLECLNRSMSFDREPGYLGSSH